ELTQGSTVSGPRRSEVDERRPEGKHEGRLRVSGVEVAARYRRAPDESSTTLVAKRVARRLQGTVVPSMRRYEQHAGEGVGAAHQLERHELEGTGADRQCAGEVRMLPRGAVRQRGRDDHITALRGDTFDERHRDRGIGAQGKVTAVLFGRSDGHAEDAVAG